MSNETVRRAPDTLLFDVWRVSRLVHGLLDESIAESGLTADEFALYSVLNASETLTPSDLAVWLAAPPTTVSSYIKRLTARGHLERTVNPKDRRSTMLRLSAAGQVTYREARRLFVPVLREVTHALAVPEADVRNALQQLELAVQSTRASRNNDQAESTPANAE